MTFRSVLRECAADLLETEDNVTVEQIVGCAYRNHPELFSAEAERMALASARVITAALLRELVEDDGEQMTFTGFGLPSAICVQSPNGTYYVRADKATWPELCAGRSIRADNVAAVQRHLDRYDDALDQVRSLMEHEPTLTLADALRRKAEAVQS
jgi:hypothetical protein